MIETVANIDWSMNFVWSLRCSLTGGGDHADHGTAGGYDAFH